MWRDSVRRARGAQKFGNSSRDQRLFAAGGCTLVALCRTASSSRRPLSDKWASDKWASDHSHTLARTQVCACVDLFLRTTPAGIICAKSARIHATRCASFRFVFANPTADGPSLLHTLAGDRALTLALPHARSLALPSLFSRSSLALSSLFLTFPHAPRAVAQGPLCASRALLLGRLIMRRSF